jgi:hypothetical protein
MLFFALSGAVEIGGGFLKPLKKVPKKAKE